MKYCWLLCCLGAIISLALFPHAAYAQPPAPKLTLQANPPEGGDRAVVVAHLQGTRGADIRNATIRFFVNDSYDGMAHTDETGHANWRLRHKLGAGSYRIAAVFSGSDSLMPARAEQILEVSATRIELSTTPATPRLGDRIVLRARVTDMHGAPVPPGRVLLFINGERQAELRTDANGDAERALKPDLAAGNYSITAEYLGGPGLLPTDAKHTTTIAPTIFTIRTTPAISGVRFTLNDRLFISGSDGIARVEVDQPGQYRVQIVPWENDASGMRPQFDRWEDPIFDPGRIVEIPAKLHLNAGFDVSYLVTTLFTDPKGQPVAPDRISAFRFSSSYGTNYDVADSEPRWLKAIHVVRGADGLTASNIMYTIESVMVDGANVVNQAQQRFTSGPRERWNVQLQLYRARFVAHDALFGFPIGSALSLTFPDGAVETRTLGPEADVTFEGLARGAYVVKLKAPGMSGITPAAISHDQEIRLLVLSYVDMAVIGVILALIALGLLLIGRPWLPKLLRDPVGLGRQLGGLPRLAPARARESLLRLRQRLMGLQRTRSQRPPLQRNDPVLISAALLVALGGLGGSLAPGIMKQTTSAVPTTISQPTTAVPNALAATTAIPAPAATVAPALAATPAPAAPEMPTQLVYRTPLQRNSQGAAVVQLQQRLRELGYFIYPENTGFFGTVTAQAVSQFQRARSLAITGIADQTLIAALNACTNACAVLPQE